MNPALTLEQWFGSIEAITVTNTFLLIIGAVFILSIWQAKHNQWQGFVHYTPNLLTSLGILGTFVGIVIGLIGFDISDIDSSIGPLLEGLKTAFITSLAGMFFAIVFKAIDSTGKLRPKSDEEQPEQATPEDILASLTRQEDSLHKLTTAIAGQEDSTLITQIRLLRSDSQDANRLRAEEFKQFSETLWKQMNDFAEMLSKSATEQVINALKEVIADFNKNLTEQFGENFKQLNVAVKALVLWQQQYKTQMEEMAEKYRLGVQAIGDTRDAVTVIGEQTRVIPGTMEALRSILETNQHQITELERHLEAFRDMRDRAVEAVPQIREQMDNMAKEVAEATKGAVTDIAECVNQTKIGILTGAEEFQSSVHRANEGLVSASDHLVNQSERMQGQLEDSVKDINDRVREMLASITEQTGALGRTLVEGNAKLQSDIREVQFQVTDSIENMQKRLEGTIEALTQRQYEQIDRAYSAMNAKMEDSLIKTTEMINRELNAIDESMQREIDRVMRQMGEALAGISRQFTSDYQELVAEMDKVIRVRSTGNL